MQLASLKKSVLAGIIALSAVSMSAEAIPVFWTLDNASFLYFGTDVNATGSFSYDADANVFSDLKVDIGGLYLDIPSITLADTYTSTSATYANGTIFSFTVSEALSNKGGTVNILGITYAGDAFVASGTMNGIPAVSAVPEPSAAWLFGVGLLGLAGLYRRSQTA